MDAHQLTVLSIWLSVIAIVLTFPLSLLANFITPALQDWSSTRSQNRLKTQLRELGDKLAFAEKLPTYMLAEWEALSMSYLTAKAVSLGFISVLGAMMLAVPDWLAYHHDLKVHSFRYLWPIQVISILGYFNMQWIFYKFGMFTGHGRKCAQSTVEQSYAKESRN